jgi:poly(A) polymerase
MLRAARFIPRFGLSVDPDLEKSVTKLGERLSIVSSERVHDELERLLGVQDPGLGFDFLERTGLLDFIVPGLDSNVRDLACVLASLSGSALVRRAGLIVLLGVPDAGGWLRSLRYSTADRHLTIRLIEGANLVLDSTSSAADIRRLVALVGVGHVGETMDLARNVAGVLDADADAGGDVGASRRARSGAHGAGSYRDDPSLRLAARVGEARSVFLELGMTENLANLTGPVSGGELIAELGLTPGPIVGQAVAMLAEHRLASGPFDKSEAFDLTRAWLSEHQPD